MASQTPISPRALRRLRELSRRIDAKLVQLDAAPLRDRNTGAFTARGTVTGKTLRKAWSTAKPQTAAPTGKASFKSALVSALRAPRA